MSILHTFVSLVILLVIQWIIVANKIAREKVSTKDNLVKNVPKRHVQGCSNIVVDEDPIIRDIMRFKEVTTYAGDVINLEEELYSSTSVGAIQVQSTHVEAMTEIQGVDQQSNVIPDMCIVGPWSDVVTDLDYNQDPPILVWFRFFQCHGF